MHDLFSPLGRIEGTVWLAIGAAIALMALIALMRTVLRGEQSRGETAAHMAHLADVAERLAMAQAELAGRVREAHTGLSTRLDALAQGMDAGLSRQGERTGETLSALHERLALIDRAQRTIAELSQQVSGLQDLLSNKQARGAFGEVQLESLVQSMLPPGSFQFQATLGNRCRADCLLWLPAPLGAMAIDAKFPLESYRALCAAGSEDERARAGKAFARDVLQHVRDIAAKYIVAGETADSALMFLPSEAVYSELHAHFRSVIEESFRRKVWIVSPSTLWATLNTVRAVLRDVRLREQAGLIQQELAAITDDVARLDERAANLQRHFEHAVDDVRQVRISADKVATRTHRLDLAALTPREADGTSSGAG